MSSENKTWYSPSPSLHKQQKSPSLHKQQTISESIAQDFKMNPKQFDSHLNLNYAEQQTWGDIFNGHKEQA